LSNGADFCVQEGFFRCERPDFLVQKTLGFSKFMVYPHRQRDKFFVILCGRPFWTVSNIN